MSNIFKNLTTDGLEESQDRIGGGFVLSTDIYSGKIKMMYHGAAKSGAQFIQLIAEFAGKEYRETVYITNKEGKNYFLNKDDKTKKVPLPGFTVINDICLITTGKPLAEQEAEEKVVNVYDFDQKKEVPKNVPVLLETIGQEISLGIVKTLENKSVKNDAGEYEATADERESNSIEKVFHTETKMTVLEATNGQTAGEFWEKWVNANKDKTRDKRTFKEGQQGKSKGTPPTAGSSAPVERKSLFNKK